MARILRIVVAIVCPPFIAAAMGAVCSNMWYGILLAYAPVAGGWIGLISRPVLDAAMDRDSVRSELSGKGAIFGAVTAFLIVLAFVPQGVDRSTLVALFSASGLFYYAIGKIGCLFLGCCRAIEGHATRVPLPAIEAIVSLGLCGVALAGAVAPHDVRLDVFPIITAALLALRMYSRVARGARLLASFAQLDSLVLVVLFVCTTVVIFYKIGSAP